MSLADEVRRLLVERAQCLNPPIPADAPEFVRRLATSPEWKEGRVKRLVEIDREIAGLRDALREIVGAAKDIKLSKRRSECLRWAAMGKSSWEIGEILGLSEHTVNFHLKKAQALLGAGNRVYAVAIAVKLGLIDVDVPAVEKSA